MKLHTDKLTTLDLQNALRNTGLEARGVDFDLNRGMSIQGSRKRARCINFYLVADDSHGRRYANSGNYGAGPSKAATWHEWGVFLGELFHRDPEAIANEYDGAEHFAKSASRTTDPPRTVEQWRTMFVDKS